MAASSSTTPNSSGVVSSRGSRRPLDDRQWTQARLQPYVNSQVRQIGASSPRARRSVTLGLVAGNEHLRVHQPAECREVRGVLLLRPPRCNECVVHVVVVTCGAYDGEQPIVVEEGQPAVAVVVGQRAEPLLPQADLRVQCVTGHV